VSLGRGSPGAGVSEALSSDDDDEYDVVDAEDQDFLPEQLAIDQSAVLVRGRVLKVRYLTSLLFGKAVQSARLALILAFDDECWQAHTKRAHVVLRSGKSHQ
jgi:hypothetical protein